MPVKKRMTKAVVRRKECLAEGIFRLTLEEEYISRHSHAGHFVNMKVPDCNHVFWRRPFSVHSTQPEYGTFQLLFSAIGRGTSVLKEIKPGEAVDLLGPLGNSFVASPELEEMIIVAGGLGAAPFKLLLQDATKLRCKKSLFLGAASGKQVCCTDDFRDLGADLVLTTEDGSIGLHGLITAPLEDYLSRQASPDKVELFVCGPTAMMRRVQELSRQYLVKGQVTVENLMACGFGACVGCPVTLAQPSHDGALYKLACKEGPVFNLNEIVFDE